MRGSWFLVFCWLAYWGWLPLAAAQTSQDGTARAPASGGAGTPVTLAGEVKTPGTYLLQPGENLRQLLHRAGGLHPSAHVFGIELRRRKEQRRQQEDLDDWSEYLQNYHQLTGGENLRHSPHDGDTALDRFRAQHELIVRLSKTKASGRVVLDLNPEAERIDDLPELPLEEGDQVFVPTRSEDVRLLGAQGFEGSFVLRGATRTDELLNQLDTSIVGVANHPVFVLLANGRLLRYAEGKRTAERVRPGDCIVMGEDLAQVTLDGQVRIWWSEFLYHRAVEYTGARFVSN